MDAYWRGKGKKGERWETWVNGGTLRWHMPDDERGDWKGGDKRDLYMHSDAICKELF